MLDFRNKLSILFFLIFLKRKNSYLEYDFKRQQQQQQLPQRQQKVDSRSASCLEEVVMSCTSAGSKAVSSNLPSLKI